MRDTSPLRLPGSSAIHCRAGSRPYSAAKCFASDRRQRQVGQRMPDKFRVDTALAIELLFEGEDDQHLAHVLPHQLDARLPPRPQLRADVINHRDPALVQLARQPKVEVGEVDEHSGVWFSPLGLGRPLCETAGRCAAGARPLRPVRPRRSRWRSRPGRSRPAASAAPPTPKNSGSWTLRAGQLAQCVHQFRAIQFA